MTQAALFQEAAVELPAKAKSTHWFTMLLNGSFISERIGMKKRYTHCIYSGNNSPQLAITRTQWKSIRCLMKEKPWKKKPEGKKKKRGEEKYIISLKAVRALHGKSKFKKLYKANLKQRLLQKQKQ